MTRRRANAPAGRSAPSAEVLALKAALDGGLRDAMQAIAARHAAIEGSSVAAWSVVHEAPDRVALVVHLVSGAELRAVGATREAALEALEAELDSQP